MANINGRSFIATLKSTTHGEVLSVGYTSHASLSDDNGWLVQSEHGQPSAKLQFDFIEDAGNRLHYRISAAPGTDYDGAKLGVSRNGYLGFYKNAEVTDFWKLELYGDDSHPELFSFVLRDARGYRVGSMEGAAGGFWTGLGNKLPPTTRLRFLNVEEGDIVYFQARIRQYL